jgi:diguanylate cyclase
MPHSPRAAKPNAWWRRLKFRIVLLFGLCSMAAAWATAWLLRHTDTAASGWVPWATGSAVALCSALAAWALLRPLSQLQRAAERMLQGPASPPDAWPAFNGELGELAQTFQDAMAQSLQRHQDSQAMLARLEAVLHHAQVGVAFSRMSHLELVSRHYCAVFQCEPADVIGKPTRIMYRSAQAYEALSARARPAFLEHGAFEGELELVRQTGEPFWAHMRGRAVIPGNLAAGTIWIIEDVTQAREQREKLTWSATHDTLTGLVNRHAFETALGTTLATGQAFCVLFMDLDRFKAVNDTGGHAAGDALLAGLAKRLTGCLRQSDVVARMGGDEFAAILPGCPAPRALVVAEKLRAAVEAFTLDWEGTRHQVGVSIGLIHAEGQFTTPAEVVRAADAACYAAKRAGRNRIASYHELDEADRNPTRHTQAGALPLEAPELDVSV